MEIDSYEDIIKILQENAKDEEIDTDLVKDIYDMEKLTLNSQTKMDEENLRQKIIKSMTDEDSKKIEEDETQSEGMEK